MIDWPWSKKENTQKLNYVCVRPSNQNMEKIVNGQFDCQNPIPFEWVNWAYQYLGKEDRVQAFGPVLNAHIVNLTYACTKYYEEDIS